jgi:hypothetical protein
MGTGFTRVEKPLPAPVPGEKPVKNPRVTHTRAHHYGGLGMREGRRMCTVACVRSKTCSVSVSQREGNAGYVGYECGRVGCMML